MSLPQGIEFLSLTRFSADDFNQMLSGLTSDAFSGSVTLDFQEGKRLFNLFFDEGEVIRVLEKFKDSNDIRVRDIGKVHSRIEQFSQFQASSHFLNRDLLHVLSCEFAFDSIILDKSIRGQEFHNLTSDITEKRYTGYLSIKQRGQETFLAFDSGNFIFDQYVASMGDLTLNQAKAYETFDKVYNSGATVSVFGGESHLVRQRVSDKLDLLAKTQTAEALQPSGFFSTFSGDKGVSVGIDIVDSWDIIDDKNLAVEIETNFGNIAQQYATIDKKQEGVITLSAKLMESLGIQEGDMVDVRPMRTE